MIKSILVFILGDAGLSLISMKAPLFRRNSKKWENESYLKRFNHCFFLPLVVFLIFIIVNWYKDTNLPNTAERRLESREIDYALVTNVDEIGDADIVYEIRKESSEEQICQIILNICRELYGDNNFHVNCEGKAYIIIKNCKTNIGYVVVSEKKYGLLLEFRWRLKSDKYVY